MQKKSINNLIKKLKIKIKKIQIECLIPQFKTFHGLYYKDNNNSHVDWPPILAYLLFFISCTPPFLLFLMIILLFLLINLLLFLLLYHIFFLFSTSAF